MTTLAQGNGQVESPHHATTSSTPPLPPPKLAKLPAEQQVLKFLKGNAARGVVEVRLLGCKSGRGRPFPMSGYFDDVGEAAQQIMVADNQYSPQGCYVTLNPVDKRLITRSENSLVEYPTTTTSDGEIPRGADFYLTSIRKDPPASRARKANYKTLWQ